MSYVKFLIAAHRTNIFPPRSLALRAAPIFSHSASLRFATRQNFPTLFVVGTSRRFNNFPPRVNTFHPLQYFSTPLHCASCRSNTFLLRSTALCAAPILSHSAPRRFDPLQYFTTTLGGASRCTNIFSRRSAAPNIPPVAPGPKNPSGCIVHRTPRKFHPCHLSNFLSSSL